MTFRVVNFGTEPLQYAITPTVLTENAETKGDYGNVQVYFATQTSRDITAQTTWTTNCANNVVTVPAKGTADGDRDGQALRRTAQGAYGHV